MEIDAEGLEALHAESWLTEPEKAAVAHLRGQRFRYAWELADGLRSDAAPAAAPALERRRLAAAFEEPAADREEAS